MDVPGPLPGAEGTEGVAVTPHLLNLDGTPLTWAELHARNEAYWATHERDGSSRIPPRPRGLSSRCEYGSHMRCGGKRLVPFGYTSCDCTCHQRTEAVQP